MNDNTIHTAHTGQNPEKYEEALAQLETIVHNMEANKYDIDELAMQLKNAKRLIRFCKDKLTKTEEELQKIQTGED